MSGGSNGPVVYTGAPFVHESKTLAQLRDRLMIRLGFAAQLAAPPPGMTELLNDFLYDAQVQMFRRMGESQRMKRWWPIPVVQGQRHYDVPSFSTGFQTNIAYTAGANDTATRTEGSFIADNFRPGQVVTIAGGANDGTKVTILTVEALTLTFLESNAISTAGAGDSTSISTVNYISLEYRKVEGVWLQRNNTWHEMHEGIDPLQFNQTSASRPYCYQWTDHIEIWPVPDRDYIMWAFGVYGLLPFAEDTDVTTISPDLVFLMALGAAKNHYRQADAGSYFRQAEVMLRNIVYEDQKNVRNIPEKQYPFTAPTRPLQA